MDKSVHKVKVDKRFQDMFDSKKFGSGSTKVDKYGRNIAPSGSKKDATNEYFFKEDASEEDSNDSEASGDQAKPEAKKNPLKESKKPKKKAEEPAAFHWSVESSSEEGIGQGDDDLHDLLGEKVIEYDFLTDDEKVEVRDISSKRLALMNYEWGKIKVGDIFIFLSSFLPLGGEIINVRLYQSEFGKDRMKKEQEHGPIAIWDENKLEDYEENESNVRLNDFKVRKYELDRLKYYYSIIEFDSGKTADIVFSQCNGIELESTEINLDP